MEEYKSDEIAAVLKSSNLNKRRYLTTLAGLTAILVAVILASLVLGRFSMSIIDAVKIILSPFFPSRATWDGTMEAVIFKLRLPRICAASLVGGALALSGASYQSMFKNPMVSPDILGVSSGAAFGASLAIFWGMGHSTIQLWAFAGGIAAVTLTAMVPKMMKSSSTIILVLAGIIVGGLMTSLMGILRYFADPDTALAEMIYWAMGSFASIKKTDLVSMTPGIIICAAVLLLIRYRLNVMSLGEDEAKTLGLNIRQTRNVIIFCSTLLTASSVCMAGTIGWVGLVIPHLGRMLVGPDNRRLLPATLIMGSAFMVIIDTLARTLTAAELPISIITGIIGAPFYLYLLLKQRTRLQ
jgi:iron complex transport system permease protein